MGSEKEYLQLCIHTQILMGILDSLGKKQQIKNCKERIRKLLG